MQKFETKYNQESDRIRSRVCKDCQTFIGHTEGKVIRCKSCKKKYKKKINQEYYIKNIAKFSLKNKISNFKNPIKIKIEGSGYEKIIITGDREYVFDPSIVTGMDDGQDDKVYILFSDGLVIKCQYQCMQIDGHDGYDDLDIWKFNVMYEGKSIVDINNVKYSVARFLGVNASDGGIEFKHARSNEVLIHGDIEWIAFATEFEKT